MNNHTLTVYRWDSGETMFRLMHYLVETDNIETVSWEAFGGRIPPDDLLRQVITVKSILVKKRGKTPLITVEDLRPLPRARIQFSRAEFDILMGSGQNCLCQQHPRKVKRRFFAS